ncbi:hypothetical protein NDU88_003944 [Pleurodeles waltl]|uniref:Uncharacterized protein n=1 Tax=Pleurodeles waltl TaxID=8319 RepID=A0AAV7V1K1_PLEWA|nr:hypothetical protein NDU88_003944 [Pleurodeles waltl]
MAWRCVSTSSSMFTDLESVLPRGYALRLRQSPGWRLAALGEPLWDPVQGAQNGGAGKERIGRSHFQNSGRPAEVATLLHYLVPHRRG